jgi:transmembrane sensor
LDAAASWYARLGSGSATDADVERHMEWLLEAPEHADAYEQVAAATQAADALEGAARMAFAKDFKAEGRQGWRSLLPGRGWPQLATAAAVAAALLFVVIFPNTDFYDEPSAPHHYAAEDGRVRTVKLADGSRVSLFGGSGITVTMPGDARIVELEAGRAFFDVVSNPARPFYVRTADRQVKVVGTRFEVIRAEGFDRVAVNEGLVAVEAAGGDAMAQDQPLMIEPGVVAHFRKEAAEPKLTRVAAETVGAWTEGVLTFRDEPLVAVVTAIDGLFPGTAVSLGPDVDPAIPFSGVLLVSSAEEMARQLADFMTLGVQTSGTGIIFTASK